MYSQFRALLFHCDFSLFNNIQSRQFKKASRQILILFKIATFDVFESLHLSKKFNDVSGRLSLKRTLQVIDCFVNEHLYPMTLKYFGCLVYFPRQSLFHRKNIELFQRASEFSFSSFLLIRKQSPKKLKFKKIIKIFRSVLPF